MRKLTVFAILIFAIAAVFLLFNANRETTPVSNKEETTEKVNSNMKIVSLAFENNSKIPSKYTCDGENINPPLQFLDVPANAKSIVLIVDDPDASSKTWVHWVVYNINPQASEVKENNVPENGIESMTDFGKPGYGGPCPPSGTHRYFFKLYALHTALDLPQTASKQMVEEKMQDHIIAQAELIGLYRKE